MNSQKMIDTNMNKVVFDLTSRLPGPLSTSNLIEYGINVYKIEERADPFKKSQIQSFSFWYEEINKNKTIVKVDKNLNLENLIKKYKPFLILATRTPKKLLNTNWLIIKGNKENIPLHDLNVWSQLGFIKKDALPCLPFAGILFSQKITSKILSIYNHILEKRLEVENKGKDENEVNYKIQEIYLLEEITKLLSPFSQDKKLTLHQGKYPCYYIYKLSDGLISLACIEEKFWAIFIKSFSLDLTNNDRLDETNRVINTLKNYFKNLSKLEVKALLADQQICVSII